MAHTAAEDDSIAPETRALSAFIVPFLVIAFVILYFWPHDTGSLFAWPIAPAMTAFLLASAYVGGAYFFVRVIFDRRWHHVWVGFLPVATFASLMLLATLLHLDKFSHGKPAFWAWISIYAVTPWLVLGAWLRNRRSDPGTPDESDAAIPASLRGALGVTGALLVAAGLGLFVFPRALIAVWPWTLTPLTARVVGSCFALTGTFGVAIARERRWTAARIALQSQMVGVALILVGAARTWGDFDTRNILSLLFIGVLAVQLVAIAAMYVWLERRRTLQPGC